MKKKITKKVTKGEGHVADGPSISMLTTCHSQKPVTMLVSPCSLSHHHSSPSALSPAFQSPPQGHMTSLPPTPKLPRWLSGKECPCQCRRHRFDPRIGKIPGGGNGNLLQYSCLANPMDRRVWRATARGVTESDTPEQLNTCAQHNET